MEPRVIDIYSRTVVQVDSFQRAAAAGLWGVIHKATEGSTYHDPKYRLRRKDANDAGLLWGAYHFNYGDNYKAQVKNYLDWAEPDANTLLVLDYEDHKSNMSIESAVAFMKEVEQTCGKSCAIYSGNRLKENIGYLGEADKAYITSKRLWLCQYGPRAVLPKGFAKYFLWQYTGDGIGPSPHTIAGFQDGQDMNVYNGTRDELATEWSD